MNALTLQELERVAEAYAELLAPALFEEWTERVADAAQVGPGHDLLDVACGTGILARAAAERVGPAGSVSGVDINPGMLAVARRISTGIDWREGAAEALPYEGNRFDAVVCQFGLMLFSNPETALREMMRVLKRGGRMAVAVFDSIEKLPAYGAMAEVYARLVGKQVGDALLRPFSMGDKAQLLAMAEKAGVKNADIATQEGFAHFSNVRHMVLADVRGWFPFAGFHLDEAMIEAVVLEAGKALEPFCASGGAVRFRVPVHIMTAVKG